MVLLSCPLHGPPERYLFRVHHDRLREELDYRYHQLRRDYPEGGHFNLRPPMQPAMLTGPGDAPTPHDATSPIVRLLTEHPICGLPHWSVDTNHDPKTLRHDYADLIHPVSLEEVVDRTGYGTSPTKRDRHRHMYGGRPIDRIEFDRAKYFVDIDPSMKKAMLREMEYRILHETPITSHSRDDLLETMRVPSRYMEYKPTEDPMYSPDIMRKAMVPRQSTEMPGDKGEYGKSFFKKLKAKQGN